MSVGRWRGRVVAERAERCDRCYWWLSVRVQSGSRLGQMMGECHYNSPIGVRAEYLSPPWPVTLPGDFCREFTKIEGEQ
jgi:hypothetical protein